MLKSVLLGPASLDKKNYAQPKVHGDSFITFQKKKSVTLGVIAWIAVVVEYY